MNDFNKEITLPSLLIDDEVFFPNDNGYFNSVKPLMSEPIIENIKKETGFFFAVSSKQKNDSKIDTKNFRTVGTLCRIELSPKKNDNGLIDFFVYPLSIYNFSKFEESEGTVYTTGTPQIVSSGSLKLEKELLLELKKLFNENSNHLDQISPYFLYDKDEFEKLFTYSTEKIIYLVASYVAFKNNTEFRYNVLKCVNNCNRLQLLIDGFHEILSFISIDDEAFKKVAERSNDLQRNYVIREKIKELQKMLKNGEDDNDDEEDEETNTSLYEKKLKNGNYPEALVKKVKNEIKRMKKMPEGSQEESLIRNYLDTLFKVPWTEETKDNDDLKNIREVLDKNHYGLSKAKERIIEYVAVKQMTGSLKAPILCLYGPPGCGKTTLAMSIAQALNRKFVKSSLGGVYDEAEIRGHRRTYIGSLPGKIINGLINVGVDNPVFLLDEIDKLGKDTFRGDPSSALLEVMDPGQNTNFEDSYLDVPYDLSKVLFIATANYLRNIPAPLLDRLELIELPSYTEIEKLQIAKSYLIEKNLISCGLKNGSVVFDDKAISYIINHYTREAGVRELERLIGKIIRKIVVETIDSKKKAKRNITIKDVTKYLGISQFEDSKKANKARVGVITGLAYTEFGGDILDIEVNSFKGNGKLILTGSLGDIMKESASIGLDYIKANSLNFGINPDIFDKINIHIHVPEGAVPKDGPSAGIAITTAIISCLTNKKISSDIAITGEITLRGNALPIGGLREKSLAALRCGISTIIVPKANKKNVDELPDEVKTNLNVMFMTNIEDALKVALVEN